MSIHVLTGDDESILRGAVVELVDRLIGEGGDRSLMVDEFDGDEYEIREVVDAAQTPPFLTDHRVVVARGVGRFDTQAVAPLVGYCADPLPTTELVLVGGGGQIPKKLLDAIGDAGGVTTNTAPPRRAKDRTQWIVGRAADDGLVLDPSAANRLASWLGDDIGRLDGLVDTLVAAYGTDTRVRAADIEPFLGDAGGVPPWDFTDAIDAGDTAGALAMLHRMTGAGERHPLQLMAILHGHYVKLARLDGSGARDKASAAAAMGIKPGFPAEKALGQYRRLGGSGVRRAFDLLAAADLDLRGDTALDEELVLEVLVARLSKLAAR